MTHYLAEKESKQRIEPPIPAKNQNRAIHSFNSRHWSNNSIIIPDVKHSAVSTDINDKTLTNLITLAASSF